MVFACMYVCIQNACPVPAKARTSTGSPGNGVTDGWVIMWTLGIWTSGRAASANCWAISPALVFYFLKFIVSGFWFLSYKATGSIVLLATSDLIGAFCLPYFAESVYQLSVFRGGFNSFFWGGGNKSFAHMYGCVAHVCPVFTEAGRGRQIPRN